MRRALTLLFFSLPLLSCTPKETTPPPPPVDSGAPDAMAPPIHVNHFCELPGSVRWTKAGATVVPGGAADAPDLRFMQLPEGFCSHYFGNIGNPRQLRFAPGGELFVASPTTLTTGGGPGGLSAVVALPDDNHDGYADDPVTFLGNLPSTQGLLFTKDHFYYQDGTRIMRVAYKSGDRAPSAPSELVADITIYKSGLHWPKTLDQADDGRIFVGNGGDQTEGCDPTLPFHGGILELDGSTGGTPVARGLRNPIAIRCSRGHNLCFAIELAKDYTADEGGREKLLPIRQGDDWGFPCCATTNLAHQGIIPPPNCAAVAPESDAFIIGSTPFGLDFELGQWPAPWKGRALVPLHGVAGPWTGVRVVAIAVNETTGMPEPGNDLGGTSTGAMADFATGWDDGKKQHGRPAAVTFAADGRLFLSNDTNGDIVWIAPVSM